MQLNHAVLDPSTLACSVVLDNVATASLRLLLVIGCQAPSYGLSDVLARILWAMP